MAYRILVVDDDEGIADAVSLILREEGYHIRVLMQGEKTYKEAITFRPHLILLDVLLSGNDGRHICKKLKEDKKTKNIPIIMLSAHPTAGNDALESGADDFIPKPFETQSLLDKIKSLLHKSSPH